MITKIRMSIPSCGICPQCAREVEAGWRVWPTCAAPLPAGNTVREAEIVFSQEPSPRSEIEEGRSPEDTVLGGGTVLNTDDISTKRMVRPIWQRRYKKIRELGHGGMGKVKLAERLSDSLLVCIKFLNDYTDLRTVEQECRALIRLRHPSIVSLLDFSLEDKPPWLATEYVDGPTLQTYLREHKALPLEAVLAMLRQILEALDYAHRERVIHRDLKPANLMIDTGQGRLRILDFGLAIIDEYDDQGQLTAQGADPLGTLLYMAPEQ